MTIYITDWALQSYLDLKHKNVFTDKEYHEIFRPDALLLNRFKSEPKFKLSSFWGPAQSGRGQNVDDGYKMKWDSVGNGRVELRFCVTFFGGVAYLCQAFVKNSENVDYRNGLKLIRYIDKIQAGKFNLRGTLK